MEDFATGELVFRHAQEVLKLGRIDLFILCRDKEGGDTEDMELVLTDLLKREEAINQENGYVEGLRDESELAMNIDDPLN